MSVVYDRVPVKNKDMDLIPKKAPKPAPKKKAAPKKKKSE
tara:strand:- start:338 stop:457 length:120 start_codon:yes stop_codon:yes gene_type:complete